MDDIHGDIPKNWRNDPLEHTATIRSDVFLRERGYENPDETRVKFLLAGRIRAIVEAKTLRQIDIVEIADRSDKNIAVQQPDVSNILNRNVKGYSVWQLMRILNALESAI